MDRLKRIIRAAVLLALVPAVLFAQDPTKDADEVKRGKLPNGVEYFIVSNPAIKSSANLALVQQGNVCVPEARHALVSLPHFGDRKPVQFFRDNGIACGPEGYVSYKDGSTMFQLRGLRTDMTAVCDSTLLMMMDLASTYNGPQAIIICGDVKAPELIQKMNLLSIILPKREGAAQENGYIRNESDLNYSFISNDLSKDAATFRLSYSLARLDRDKMSTMSAIVAKQYATYFGTILTKRIIRDFRQNLIPLASISFHYLDSSEGPEDESLELELVCAKDSYDKAVERIGSILASLKEKGAVLAELQEAKDELVFSSFREAAKPKTDNQALVEKCRAAYLYGGPISSGYSVALFFATNRLSGEKELELFNNYVNALLDRDKNLTLAFDGEFDSSGTTLPDTFHSGWDRAGSDSLTHYRAAFADTAGLIQTGTTKVKLRSSGQYLADCPVWTFTNGMRVVFKKSAAKGTFSYAMMIRGGTTSIKDLEPGENSYIGDMLTISNIGGLTGNAFRNAMEASGITMTNSVSPSELTIRGIAPSDKLPLLLSALVTVANERSFNEQAFQYYKATEPLRIQVRRNGTEGVRDVIDSLIAPDWEHQSCKRESALSDNTPQKAERFFNAQFNNCSDGIIVLIGDLDEITVKKQLCAALGQFKTSRRNTVQPPLKRNCTTGHITRADEALSEENRGVNITLSNPFEFKIKDYVCQRLAAVAIEDLLSRRLSIEGIFTAADTRLELYPENRFTLYLHFRSCPASGQPEGEMMKLGDQITAKVQDCLDTMRWISVSDAELARWKARLINIMDNELADDTKLMDAIITRYSLGKDIVKDYAKAIGSIDAETLQEQIKSFVRGGRVDYILM